MLLIQIMDVKVMKGLLCVVVVCVEPVIRWSYKPTFVGVVVLPKSHLYIYLSNERKIFIKGVRPTIYTKTRTPVNNYGG